MNYLDNISKEITEFIIFVIEKYNPGYLQTHPRITVTNTCPMIEMYLLVIVGLITIITILLVRRLMGKKYNTKKSVIVLSSVLILATVIFSCELLLGGQETQRNGFKLEYLQYQPGNQPITDAIVGDVRDNLIPDVVEIGEKIVEVTYNPELAFEIVEEFTGVNISEITQDVSKYAH